MICKSVLLVVSGISLVLVGCGRKQEQESQKQPVTEPPAPSQETTVEAPPAPLPKPEPDVPFEIPGTPGSREEVVANGGTPLHLAVWDGDINAVTRLVKQDRKLRTAVDNSGNTALHLAIMLRKSELVSGMLETECSHAVAVANKEGLTPLDFALVLDDNQTAKALLGLAPASLMKTVTRNDPETLRMCLEIDRGWLSHGPVLLYNAAYRGNREVVEFLLEQGVDVNAPVARGMTALHKASIDGKSGEMIKLLVSKGADVNARDDQNRTPLHLAAQNRGLQGAEDVTRALVECGAEVDAREGSEDNGLTPLHYAALYGRARNARVLIESGADIQLTSRGYTTLTHAVRGKDASSNVVLMLIKNGADVNEPNEAAGETPLHIAARKGRWDIVRDLLQNGASKNSTNRVGRTIMDDADSSVRKVIEEW